MCNAALQEIRFQCRQSHTCKRVAVNAEQRKSMLPPKVLTSTPGKNVLGWRHVGPCAVTAKCSGHPLFRMRAIAALRSFAHLFSRVRRVETSNQCSAPLLVPMSAKHLNVEVGLVFRVSSCTLCLLTCLDVLQSLFELCLTCSQSRVSSSWSAVHSGICPHAQTVSHGVTLRTWLRSRLTRSNEMKCLASGSGEEVV